MTLPTCSRPLGPVPQPLVGRALSGALATAWLGAQLWSAPVAAQTTPVSALGAEAVLVTELSRNVRLGFFGREATWSNARPGELRIDRSLPDQLQLIGSSGAVWTLHLQSWVQTVRPAGRAADPVLSHESTRPPGALASGQKWTARMVAEQEPVSWCADSNGIVDSAFEVGPVQTYALKIDGQARNVEVLPVVEKGRWTRCVSGQRHTRLLYAPVLDSVVSVEFISYRPSGDPHESSFRFQVTEIRQTARP